MAFAGSWRRCRCAACGGCTRRGVRPPEPVPADAPGAADCGLVAVGLLVWQPVDFLYADIGGPSTVLTAVVLGLVAWWALAPSPDSRRTRRPGR